MSSAMEPPPGWIKNDGWRNALAKDSERFLMAYYDGGTRWTYERLRVNIDTDYEPGDDEYFTLVDDYSDDIAEHDWEDYEFYIRINDAEE